MTTKTRTYILSQVEYDSNSMMFIQSNMPIIFDAIGFDILHDGLSLNIVLHGL